MYNKFTLAKKYLAYLLKAKKLHGVHSPFVYNFSTDVLYKIVNANNFIAIENERNLLLADNTKIEITDLGAGSRTLKTKYRTIKNIAQTSLKPKKWALLLYKIIDNFKPVNVIELGTCLGITSSYIAKALHNNGTLYTIEGSQHIHTKANEVFEKLNLKNIKSYLGNFDEVYPTILATLKTNNENLNVVYIDGNHRYEPTIDYFKQSLALCNNYSILIFDDIHWSQEMEQAWECIKQHDAVTISIDLFFIGIVFLRKEQQEKEHFILKY